MNIFGIIIVLVVFGFTCFEIYSLVVQIKNRKKSKVDSKSKDIENNKKGD